MNGLIAINNNGLFQEILKRVDSPELEAKKENKSNKKASFLDTDMKINGKKLKLKSLISGFT